MPTWYLRNRKILIWNLIRKIQYYIYIYIYTYVCILVCHPVYIYIYIYIKDDRRGFGVVFLISLFCWCYSPSICNLDLYSDSSIGYFGQLFNSFHIHSRHLTSEQKIGPYKNSTSNLCQWLCQSLLIKDAYKNIYLNTNRHVHVCTHRASARERERERENIYIYIYIYIIAEFIGLL